MSHPSEHSTGSNAAAVIVIVLLILGLFCGGGLVLLGGLFYARAQVAPATVAPVPVVDPLPELKSEPAPQIQQEPEPAKSEEAAPELKPKPQEG
jgi:hypothetical protein